MRWLPFSSSHNHGRHHHHDDEHNRLFGKISRPLIRPLNLSEEDLSSSVSTRAFKSLERNEDESMLTGLATKPRPQPLPLPEFQGRKKDGCNGSGLPSPDNDGSDRCSGSGNRVYAHQDTRRLAQHGDAHISNAVRQDPYGIGGSRHNLNVAVPVISAPTSPYSSPACSPPSIYYPVESRGNKVWSAPEMPFHDMVSVTSSQSHSHLDHTSRSNDCSPLHSPAARSPPPNPSSSATSPVHPNRSSSSTSPVHPNRSSSATSPVHPNISCERSSSRHENLNHVNVHPLPLPPGATCSSASPGTSQAMTKVDTLPMKSHWQKGKLIGRGTFGSVYAATNRKTGALCAMKEVEMLPDDPKSVECIKQLQQEIKVLSQLKHPNIVRYYGSEIIDEKFYIYLEYVHPGSINKYVRENCGAVTESVVRCFTRHILRGLAYLHSKKTIHRDIKGANLLVDSCGVVKLADFGMAKHLTGQRADLSLKGSPYWMAPELMQAVMQKDNSSNLALAVDIWSLGCTIIEMLTGKPPWSEYEGAAAMFKVMKDTPPIPNTLSPEGKDFLQLCFCRNPAARPSAAMLLDHQFLRD